jgi:Fe-Mn family superoxide dismutase
MSKMKQPSYSRRSFIRTLTGGVISGAAIHSMPRNSLAESTIANDRENIETKTINQKGESTMAYEWKFKPRPYSDEEAKKLLSNVMSTETTDWHYNTHHKGYVTALNNIEKGLETADRATANGNYSVVGELKRRLTWNHSGALLHDLYWEVLGGDGDPKKGPEILAAWKTDFRATAISAKLSGWGLLVYDALYSQRLLDVLVDEHQYGAIWGGVPLISLDVFEHAYYHKDGPGRAKYIDNFIANLHWGRINERYKKYVLR